MKLWLLAVSASHLIKGFNKAIHAGDPVGGIFNTIRMADLQAAIVAAGVDEEDQVWYSAARICISHPSVRVCMNDISVQLRAGMALSSTRHCRRY